jgi:hypothetical protein
VKLYINRLIKCELAAQQHSRNELTKLAFDAMSECLAQNVVLGRLGEKQKLRKPGTSNLKADAPFQARAFELVGMKPHIA